jgi:membrane protein YqaA with SNARE-associated domain
MKKYILILLLILSMSSCSSFSNLLDTGKDAGLVAAVATGGSLLGGPVTGGLAAGATYLLVDDVNNIEFIEEHVVKTVVQETVLTPTLSLFLAKFKFYITIVVLALLLFKREWLLIPIKFLLKKKPDSVNSKRLDG